MNKSRCSFDMWLKENEPVVMLKEPSQLAEGRCTHLPAQSSAGGLEKVDKLTCSNGQVVEGQ